MRIAVLGTFLKDRIIDAAGRITESKGGLFYTVDALRAVCHSDDTIVPISFVGNDFWEQVVEHFAHDSRVDLSGLYRFDGPNNCVELRYLTSEQREERSLNPLPPLSAQQLQPFATCDVFVANFISGWEVKLADFRQFAAAFNGLLAIDIHSLTLERTRDGLRRLRPLANVEKWIEFAQIVQCNVQEFKQISDLTPEAFYKLFCFNQKKIVNLTNGSNGSLHIFTEGDTIKQIQVPAETRVNVLDPTGCGDVFLAGFVYFYATGHSVQAAAQKANTLAALAGKTQGLREWQELGKEFNQLVGRENG